MMKYCDLILLAILLLFIALLSEPRADVVTQEPSQDAVDVWEMENTCPKCAKCECWKYCSY